MSGRRNSCKGWTLAVVVGLMLAPFVANVAIAKHWQKVCSTTTTLLSEACKSETMEDGLVAEAVCLNLTESADRWECRNEAYADLWEMKTQCREQYAARKEVCSDLGQAAYDPEIDPANFVEGIDNPLTPFAVGSKWVYEKDGEDGLDRFQRNRLPVLAKLGVIEPEKSPASGD